MKEMFQSKLKRDLVNTYSKHILTEIFILIKNKDFC